MDRSSSFMSPNSTFGENSTAFGRRKVSHGDLLEMEVADLKSDDRYGEVWVGVGLKV